METDNTFGWEDMFQWLLLLKTVVSLLKILTCMLSRSFENKKLLKLLK